MRQLFDPGLVAARVIAAVPDDAAGLLGRHWPEPKARVGPNDALVQLPHRLPVIQELEERPHADGDQDRQRHVEDEVEQRDLGWKTRNLWFESWQVVY